MHDPLLLKEKQYFCFLEFARKGCFFSFDLVSRLGSLRLEKVPCFLDSRDMLGVLLGAIDEISHHNQWQIRPRKICYALNDLSVCHQMPYIFGMLLAINCHKDMKGLCPLRKGFNFCWVICFNKYKLAILFNSFKFGFLIPGVFGQ